MAVLATIVTPIAIAGAQSPASASSAKSTLKQIKLLKKQTAQLANQVAALEAKTASLEGRKQPTPSTQPSGPAGGDLTASYPNPQIRSGAIHSSDISDAAITGNKISSDAIESSNILNGTILSEDIANGTLSRGDLGVGSVGADQLGTIDTVKSHGSMIGGTNATGAEIATCGPGEQLIGGGFEWSASANNLTILASAPDATNPEGAWFVLARNNSGTALEIYAHAVCLRL